MTKSKICHLITTLGSGGAESMLARLVVYGLRISTFDHVVISLTDDGVFGKFLRDRGVKVFSIGMKRPSIAGWALVRLRSLLRRERPAILMSWLYHADFLALIIGRIAGVRRIVWNIRTSKLDFDVYDGSIKYVFQANRVLSHYPDLVIYNSLAGCQHHRAAGFNPKRWTYLPNGFDLDLFRPNPSARRSFRNSLRLDDSTFLIGMVARYDPVKDHKTFLAAAADLSKQVNNVHFVLVGRDRNGQLSACVESSPIRHRVHFLGERKDIADINAALDLATLTSSFGEGFPNVLGEAMACGVPCVSTDVGDASKIIGGYGIIVPPMNTTALSSAWERILRMDSGERIRMGSEARRHIEQHFSLPVVAMKYDRLFDELMRD
jgi:glycosyltransferase involved in cell wall biosynthesis